MTTKLKLGALPKKELVKITIAVPVELKTLLDRYAELHADVSGETNELSRLIPYMLEAFIDSDQVFRKATRSIPSR